MKTIYNPIYPEKLYNCKATYDYSGLTSYKTQTVMLSDDVIRIHLVHTPTTMMHVRKYIQFLRECGQQQLSDIIESLYHLCIYHKAVDAQYLTDTGEIDVFHA